MPCVYRHMRLHRAFLLMWESMAEMMLFHAKSTYFIIKSNLSKRRSDLCHLSQSACEYRHIRKFYIIRTAIFMRFCAINCGTCQSGRRKSYEPYCIKNCFGSTQRSRHCCMRNTLRCNQGRSIGHMRFRSQRFLTRGVASSIPLPLQLTMWGMIEQIPTPDYLQIFTLTGKDGEQSILHEQEEPVYCRKVLLPYPYPVNAKVYVIDDDTHCTMLLAEEY